MIHRVATIATLFLMLATSTTWAATAWTSQGVPFAAFANTQDIRAAASDGSGGMIVAWGESRFDVAGDVFAQRIDKYGNEMWQNGGVPVSAAAGNQGNQYILIEPDGAGGAYIVWDDNRTGFELPYIQRIDSNGSPMFAVDGIAVIPAGGEDLVEAVMAPHPTGDGVVVIVRRPAFSFDHIYGKQVRANGDSGWGGTFGAQLTTTPSFNVTVTNDGASTLLAWSDERNATQEIYVQKLDATGIRQWTANGVNVSGGNLFVNPAIVPDGGGGMFVLWEVSGFGLLDVRRVDAAGGLATNVVGIETFGLALLGKDMISDGAGGAFIVWSVDRGAGYTVYAQRVINDAHEVWGVSGIASIPTKDGYYPRAVPDGEGGFVAVYESSTGILGQRFSSSGLRMWTDQGTTVRAVGYTALPVASDEGAVLTALSTNENGTQDGYAQRIEPRHGAWGFPEPRIVSVDDVPNDQGGYVQVKWEQSDHDVLGISAIGYYSVWRALDAPVAREAIDNQRARLIEPGELTQNHKGPAIMLRSDRTGTAGGESLAAATYFEWIENMGAFQLPQYALTVATTSTSNPSDSGTHYFQVIAHGTATAFVSAPDSGAAVDNLAPAPASLLAAQRTGNDVVVLDWTPGGETDPGFAGYFIYRAPNSGGPYTLIGSSPDTTGTDSTATWGQPFYYVVTAYDVNGTESAQTNEAMVNGVATSVGEPVPTASMLLLGQNYPNPFSANAAANLHLREATDVTLEVFDVAGHRVSLRRLGTLAAGDHVLRLSGRDDTASVLPSGVYFYRITTPTASQTRKMVIQR